MCIWLFCVYKMAGRTVSMFCEHTLSITSCFFFVLAFYHSTAPFFFIVFCKCRNFYFCNCTQLYSVLHIICALENTGEIYHSLRQQITLFDLLYFVHCRCTSGEIKLFVNPLFIVNICWVSNRFYFKWTLSPLLIPLSTHMNTSVRTCNVTQLHHSTHVLWWYGTELKVLPPRAELQYYSLLHVQQPFNPHFLPVRSSVSRCMFGTNDNCKL